MITDQVVNAVTTSNMSQYLPPSLLPSSVCFQVPCRLLEAYQDCQITFTQEGASPSFHTLINPLTKFHKPRL
jgi:hypothetical protein